MDRRAYWRKSYYERRRFLDSYKLEKGCEICGYNQHPAALTFDHLNPEEKSFPLGDPKCRSWQKIIDEVAKCRVLCANCHNIFTYDSNFFTTGEVRNLE